MTPILRGKFTTINAIFRKSLFDRKLSRHKFPSNHQTFISQACALCAMLTFKSGQTADEKINEVWEFDLVVGGG